MASARPPLPARHANPHLSSDVNPSVKYQLLNCQGNDILVGRLKIPTPHTSNPRTSNPVQINGHAFILRRFDTDAISLTTMFRAAYPTASEEDERREVNYVRAAFDLSGNNGSSKDTTITRLAGTWVSKDVAMELARDYGLESLMETVCDAVPDESVAYRRSGKSAVNSPGQGVTHTGVPALDVPVTKKSRRDSPVQSSPAKPLSKSTPIKTPSKPVSTPSKQTPTKTAPRKSTPRSAIPTLASNSTPRKEQTVRALGLTKPDRPSSPDTVVGVPKEDDEKVVSNVAAHELHDQDVREQKDMIDRLKAQRSATDVEMEIQPKRTREQVDEGPKFEFREPEPEDVKENRLVVSNKRVVRRFQQLQPEQKSVAWGVAAFAVGISAIRFLPDLVGHYLPL